jgi:Phage capsid protein
MGPITDAHKLTYQMNVELAVQQIRSKLEPSMTYEPSLKGRLACMLELIGQTNAVLNLGRAADTPNIDNQIEPIWIQPTQIAWGKIIEKEDAIKALTDYQSPFVQAGAAAIVRAVDTIMATAVFGPRRIGLDGGTTSTWAGKTVATTVGSANGATDVGMNVAKIIRARRLMQEDQVDLGMEELYLGLNAQQQEELFRDLTYISSDYRDVHVLDRPLSVDILDVTILPPLDGAAALPDADTTHFNAGLWCKSGMYYGDFSPVETQVPLRPDKLMRPHPQMERWCGASRSEDKKSIKIITLK